MKIYPCSVFNVDWQATMKITAPLAILLINLLMKATSIQEVPGLDLEFIAEEFLTRNKVISSNPLKSNSGGQFSPVSKGLLAKFAHLNMKQQHKESADNQTFSTSTHTFNQQASQSTTSKSVSITQSERVITYQAKEEQKNFKRKLTVGEDTSNRLAEQQSLTMDKASPIKVASQEP